VSAAQAKPSVMATLPDGTEKIFKGRYAWTLNQLVNAGHKGVTPIERPAPRWSHYVMMLRRAGIKIETIDEKHGGPFAGTHGRYVLRDDIILSDPPPIEKPAAGSERALNPNIHNSKARGLDNE